MGCSHKCAYDYDIEDYKCTCPPKLTLGANEKICYDPEVTPTIAPPIKCDWAEWSEWSDCSTTCGQGFRKRSREVKEGECAGRENEQRLCGYPKCPVTPRVETTPEDEVVTVTPVYAESSTSLPVSDDSEIEATTVTMSPEELLTESTTLPSESD